MFVMQANNHSWRNAGAMRYSLIMRPQRSYEGRGLPTSDLLTPLFDQKCQ
jgi:hypothetical protein